MSSKRPRPLRPAPPAAPEDEPSASGPSEPPPPPKNKGRGITRISTACEACKRRKSRCSGPPAPCTICRAQGTACVIDESLDHRRKSAIHRLRDGVVAPNQLLNALVQSLRFSEEEDFQDLSTSIRENLPAAETAAILKRNLETLRARDKLFPVDLTELQSAFMRLTSAPPSEAATETSVDDTPGPVEPGSMPGGAAGGMPPGSGHTSDIESAESQDEMYQQWIAMLDSFSNAPGGAYFGGQSGSGSGTQSW